MKQNDTTQYYSPMIQLCDQTSNLTFKTHSHARWAKFFDKMDIKYKYLANEAIPATWSSTFYLPKFNTADGVYVTISTTLTESEVIQHGVETLLCVPDQPSLVGYACYTYDNFRNLQKDVVIFTDRSVKQYRFYFNPQNIRVGEYVSKTFIDRYCHMWEAAVVADVQNNTIVHNTVVRKPTFLERRSVFVQGVEVSILTSIDGYMLVVGDKEVMLTPTQMMFLQLKG